MNTLEQKVALSFQSGVSIPDIIELVLNESGHAELLAACRWFLSETRENLSTANDARTVDAAQEVFRAAIAKAPPVKTDAQKTD